MAFTVQDKKLKIDFKDGCHGGHLGFLIGMILSIFDLQVTLMLPFSSGEEVKNRLSKWLPWRPSWISNQNDFSHFKSLSHPDASYRVSSQLAFGLRRRRKKDFQHGYQGSHLGFPISMVLAIFDLQVTLMPPTTFGVNWPLGSGEEVKNRLSRWQPSWISNWNDFSDF